MLDKTLLNNWISDIQEMLEEDDIDQIKTLVGGICIEIKAHLQDDEATVAVDEIK